MKKLNKILFGSEGFSLGEVVVTAGLVAVVGLVSTHFIQRATKQQKDFSTRADAVISQLQVERFLEMDFADSLPSLNYLVQEAEKREGNCPVKNFWSISKNMSHESCRMEINLDEDGEEFYALVKSRGIKVNVSPAVFYNVNKQSLSFNQAKVKSFLSENGYDRDGLILKFQSPTYVPDQKISGIFHSYSMFMGVKKGGSIEGVDFKEVSFQDDMHHKCSTGIQDFDTFLRCLPQEGDSASIDVLPVKLIKYKLKHHDPERPELGLDLYRYSSKLLQGKLTYSSMKLGEKLERINLLRKSLSDPSFTINVIQKKVR